MNQVGQFSIAIVQFEKLPISVFFIKRDKLLIKTLKRIGPSIDLCGVS